MSIRSITIPFLALLLSACSSGGGGGGGDDGGDTVPAPSDPSVIMINITDMGLEGTTAQDAIATMQAQSGSTTPKTLSDSDTLADQSFDLQAALPGDLSRPNLSDTDYQLELQLAPPENPAATTSQTVLVLFGPRQTR